MTTLADQLERVQWLLQDVDTSLTNQSKIILQHQEEIARLAERHCFPQITWLQGFTGFAVYTLPDNAVHIAHVLYNQKALRFVTEASLDRASPGWEQRTDDPAYWTTTNQAPNVIRLIPTPVRTGSSVPVIPGLPMMMDPVDNLVVFHTEDLSFDADDPSDTMPTMSDYDDVLVYTTAARLAGQETPRQNLSVSQACEQLAALWMQLLGKG